MKRIVLLMTIVMVAIGLYAQKSSVEGDYLLSKADVKGKVFTPYFMISFSGNQDINMNNEKVGSWKYNEAGKTLQLESEFLKGLNGVNKIVKLDDKSLVLQRGKDKYFFERFDKEGIATINKKSGISGNWEFSVVGEPEHKRYINFAAPYTFNYNDVLPGVSTAGSGIWVYQPASNKIMLIGRIEDLAVETKVIELSADKMVLENKGVRMEGKRIIQSLKLEHLNFTEDDMYDENGEFNYADEDKLPWQDPYEMMESLKKINKLDYKYSSYLKDIKDFKSSVLTAVVKTEEEHEKMCMDYIFGGYDRTTLQEGMEMSVNCTGTEDFNLLFPGKDMIYKVVGKETVTTPVATFSCTVVNAIDGFNKVKLWMIDNKPGVFAKVIVENSDENMGFYHVFELKQIH